MILLVTNRRDLTTDYIVRELERRMRPYVRLNTETLGKAMIILSPQAPDDDVICLNNAQLRLSEIRAAYFRRPEPPEIADDVGEASVRAYCAAEWSALLKTLIGRLGGIWFSDPTAIVHAEDKPRQLLAARRLGFRVPETLIANAPAPMRRFVAAHRAVAKPLRHALLDDDGPGRVMFTTRVTAADLGDDAGLTAAPVILQAEVEKDCDLRVTVVGDKTFTVAIRSQAYAETQVDWRRGVRPDLVHDVVDLPRDVAAACVGLTKDLGLGFGAIDLIRDPGGEHWFLEINPNGQWAWIENRAGLPIAAEIVDRLEAIADR